MSTAQQSTIPQGVDYTHPDRLVQDFASRGLVLLSPESLGIPVEVHERVYEKEKAAYLAEKRVTPFVIPDILEVLNASGLVSACNQLVGENWAIVPFTHNASFTSGPRDQHWHKDDNGPYNARKQRHHQAVQIEMLYYPQQVSADMGPTATIPYSQYWTFNHEENQDNFAGADHLDFDYMLSGMERRPVSGPDSKYEIDEIVNARTPHDIRMREAVTDTGWPLVKSFEAAPLRAGSVLLYSHNTFHRGNHRRDDWRTWKDNPRFMWRFWLYRTTEPNADSAEDVDWTAVGPDRLTGIDTAKANDDVTVLWRYHHHWIRTGKSPATLETPERKRVETAEELRTRLYAEGEDQEPTRIGAAYRLAQMSDRVLAIGILSVALYDDRESVRRAATYGLIAAGEDATDTFLTATTSEARWIRKAGVYGLGDASSLTEQVLDAVTVRLKNDPSVYVRSVAAGTLGCLGRRAIGRGEGTDLVPACAAALLESLGREDNRPCMDKAQGRSIKFVRPTDNCDVCEGGRVDFGFDRFDSVRSAVRENALWSLVILCSHGSSFLGDSLQPTIGTLRGVVRTERNAICVGFAQDALSRLANLTPESESRGPIASLQSTLLEVLGDAPVRPWEAIVRAGVDPTAVSHFQKE